jgi:hypothetical protein
MIAEAQKPRSSGVFCIWWVTGFGRTSPYADTQGGRVASCRERQVTGPTRSYREILYSASLTGGSRAIFPVPDNFGNGEKVLEFAIPVSVLGGQFRTIFDQLFGLTGRNLKKKRRNLLERQREDGHADTKIAVSASSELRGGQGERCRTI